MSLVTKHLHTLEAEAFSDGYSRAIAEVEAAVYSGDLYDWLLRVRAALRGASPGEVVAAESGEGNGDG